MATENIPAINKVPAAVVPATAAIVHQNTHQIFHELMCELSDTNAFLEGALGLVERSEHISGDSSLCNARTLLDHCMERQQATCDKIDTAMMGEIDDIEELAAGGTDAPNLAAVEKLIMEALFILRHGDQEQPTSKELFEIKAMLEQAATLAKDLSGAGVKAARSH